MQLDFIEKLIDIFERSTLLELDYVDGDSRVRLSRAGGEGETTVSRSQAQPSHAPATRPPADPIASAGPVSSDHTIAAGMVGTFYRRPAPDKEPYVAVGDAVEDGQTLALLEAMKMLIPVEADRAGRIAAILVEDAALIETGTPLFVIEPLG